MILARRIQSILNGGRIQSRGVEAPVDWESAHPNVISYADGFRYLRWVFELDVTGEVA